MNEPAFCLAFFVFFPAGQFQLGYLGTTKAYSRRDCTGVLAKAKLG